MTQSSPKPPDLNKADRRKTARADVQIWVEEKSGRSTSFHLITNLSTSGFFIEKRIPFLIGSILKLELTLPGSTEKIRVTGKVVNNYRDPESNAIGTGVEFVDIDETTTHSITNYLKQLK